MRLTVLAVCLAAVLPASAAELSAVHCGHLFDPIAGKLLGETTIVIDGERIQSVQAGAPAAGMKTVELGNATCLPGLIDSHVHLTMQFSATSYSDQFRLNPADNAIRGTVYARRTLQAGFTTVRNLADDHNESIALRNAIDKGITDGPRILTAGKAIGSTGGHADPTDGYRMDLAGDPGPQDGIINSPEDAWKAVRQHYKDGADLIKIMPSGGVLDESRSADNPQMTLEEIKAIVAAAHDYGFAVAAHAHGAEAIRRAVIAGVDSIEHGTFIDEQGIKDMKARGTYYVATLKAFSGVANALGKGIISPASEAKTRQTLSVWGKGLNLAYRNGVKIALGTDSAVAPHSQANHEVELMVSKGGMTPRDALIAATKGGPDLMNLSAETGTLVPGKSADLIAVEGDPLVDPTAVQRVDYVMVEGHPIPMGGK